MLMKEKFNDEVKLDREKVRKVMPQKLHKWLKVFGKAKSKRIPVRKPWDHVINLREDFVPRKKNIFDIKRREGGSKGIYKGTVEKRVYQAFKVTLDFTSVLCREKNEKKRIVINTIGIKRVFTKTNLYQRYNNVQMKERNKQKAMFIMYLGVYKSIVMFFGLTNSLVTFQAIINDILRDLIDTGDMAVFMDNALVGTKNKRRYNKIIEKVLKRIKANNLYIKPKKYMQKVKEIVFLGLVIETNGIKMQKEKVVEVLE